MTTRCLAAILAADVVGFSSLIGPDEEGTLARIKPSRKSWVQRIVAQVFPRAPLLALGDMPSCHIKGCFLLGRHADASTWPLIPP